MHVNTNKSVAGGDYDEKNHALYIISRKDKDNKIAFIIKKYIKNGKDGKKVDETIEEISCEFLTKCKITVVNGESNEKSIEIQKTNANFSIDKIKETLEKFFPDEFVFVSLKSISENGLKFQLVLMPPDNKVKILPNFFEFAEKLVDIFNNKNTIKDEGITAYFHYQSEKVINVAMERNKVPKEQQKNWDILTIIKNIPPVSKPNFFDFGFDQEFDISQRSRIKSTKGKSHASIITARRFFSGEKIERGNTFLIHSEEALTNTTIGCEGYNITFNIPNARVTNSIPNVNATNEIRQDIVLFQNRFMSLLGIFFPDSFSFSVIESKLVNDALQGKIKVKLFRSDINIDASVFNDFIPSLAKELTHFFKKKTFLEKVYGRKLKIEVYWYLDDKTIKVEFAKNIKKIPKKQREKYYKLVLFKKDDERIEGYHYSDYGPFKLEKKNKNHDIISWIINIFTNKKNSTNGGKSKSYPVNNESKSQCQRKEESQNENEKKSSDEKGGGLFKKR